MVVVAIFSIFGAQLVRIQGFDASAVAEAALQQRTKSELIPALRGEIRDSSGVVLAESQPKRLVNVDQTAISTYKKRVNGVRETVGVLGAAEDLAPLLGQDPAELLRQLTGTSRYQVIARDVSPLTWRSINKLGIPGVYSEPETARSYPQSTATAPLVGFVHADGRAGAGAELLLDSVLKGTAGEHVQEVTATGRPIPNGYQEVTEPTPGRDVTLTINSSLQWYAQNALAQQIVKVGALSGTIVVQHAKTGELLAVATYPTFDPSDIKQIKGTVNRAFAETFEPGSTNKIITIAAALQEKVVTPTTPVVVPNRLPRSDQSFKDAHDHRTQYMTVAGVLAESSNIGTILAGEGVAPKTLEGYFRAFGLGEKTPVGFPGELAGAVGDADEWNGSQRYTVMYGQGMSVTAVQAVGAMQTIANHGVRVPPSLVASVTDEGGNVVTQPRAAGIRVVTPEVADQVSSMLESAASPEGTAKAAQIPGYRIAGKTGTADRYDERLGRYSGRTSSFIGYAPADDPEIVVGIFLQRPTRGFYGGELAAPVFRTVTTYALQELGIPPTTTKHDPFPIMLPEPPSPSDPTVLGKKYLPARR